MKRGERHIRRGGEEKGVCKKALPVEVMVTHVHAHTLHKHTHAAGGVGGLACMPRLAHNQGQDCGTLCICMLSLSPSHTHTCMHTHTQAEAWEGWRAWHGRRMAKAEIVAHYAGRIHAGCKLRTLYAWRDACVRRRLDLQVCVCVCVCVCVAGWR